MNMSLIHMFIPAPGGWSLTNHHHYQIPILYSNVIFLKNTQEAWSVFIHVPQELMCLKNTEVVWQLFK